MALGIRLFADTNNAFETDKLELASLRISLCDDWLLEDVRAKWFSLAALAYPNAYLSWRWISAWLTLCPNKPLCIQAVIDGELVGMGFLYPRVTCPFPGLSLKQLWLHRLGQDDLDQIWIEHNDFLLDRRFQDQVRERMVNFLQFDSGYHELYFGLSADQSIPQTDSALRPCRIVMSAPSYSLPLSGFSSKEDYLHSLSKNTRAQIVRTQKLISERYGPLKLLLAKTESDKKLYLEHAASLHQQRWSESEFGSGFDNAVFTQFHQDLIMDDGDNAGTRLYKLQAGEEVFGYIYLLTDASSWKFYLSAIRFDDDNRIKVGLLFHALVIEEAIKQRISTYDFLAGEARYKKSLSHKEDQQLMYCFYKPSLITSVRETLRTLKQRFCN